MQFLLHSQTSLYQTILTLLTIINLFLDTTCLLIAKYHTPNKISKYGSVQGLACEGLQMVTNTWKTYVIRLKLLFQGLQNYILTCL